MRVIAVYYIYTHLLSVIVESFIVNTKEKAIAIARLLQDLMPPECVKILEASEAYLRDEVPLEQLDFAEAYMREEVTLEQLDFAVAEAGAIDARVSYWSAAAARSAAWTAVRSAARTAEAKSQGKSEHWLDRTKFWALKAGADPAEVARIECCT